jgi:pimeloyl-ACP methyl ester carboxylesterase
MNLLFQHLKGLAGAYSPMESNVATRLEKYGYQCVRAEIFVVVLRVWLVLMAVLTFFLCTAATQAKTYSGWLGKSAYRIDLPDKNWNGDLVMYCHSLRLSPLTPADMAVPDSLKPIMDDGFAIAQAGYSAPGWNMHEAVEDTEALRKYFSEKIKKPARVFIVGESMGGVIVPVLLERADSSYSAGLSLCSSLTSPDWFVMRKMLDLRVVFDYFFPGALPSVTSEPPAQGEEDLMSAILQALENNAQKATDLRSYSGITSNEDLATSVVVYTLVLSDIRWRSGGNPFDNRYAVYEGTSVDADLNKKVARYAPDPQARRYVLQYYPVTGNLQRPLMAVVNLHDPLIPATMSNYYPSLVSFAGHSNRFVERAVNGQGHCGIAPGEIHRDFVDLVQWQTTGAPPRGGFVDVP